MFRSPPAPASDYQRGGWPPNCYEAPASGVHTSCAKRRGPCTHHVDENPWSHRVRTAIHLASSTLMRPLPPNHWPRRPSERPVVRVDIDRPSSLRSAASAVHRPTASPLSSARPDSSRDRASGGAKPPLVILRLPHPRHPSAAPRRRCPSSDLVTPVLRAARRLTGPRIRWREMQALVILPMPHPRHPSAAPRPLSIVRRRHPCPPRGPTAHGIAHQVARGVGSRDPPSGPALKPAHAPPDTRPLPRPAPSAEAGEVHRPPTKNRGWPSAALRSSPRSRWLADSRLAGRGTIRMARVARDSSFSSLRSPSVPLRSPR
jgi:hypothetical protein